MVFQERLMVTRSLLSARAKSRGAKCIVLRLFPDRSRSCKYSDSLMSTATGSSEKFRFIWTRASERR
jgi:hypothetical protein